MSDTTPLRRGNPKLKDLGRGKVVLETGTVKTKMQLKESDKDDWFHSLNQQAAKREAAEMNMTSGAQDKLYKGNKKDDLKGGDQSEYFFKKAYGLSAKQSPEKGKTPQSPGREGEEANKKLISDYIAFDEKRDREDAVARAEGKEVSDDEDSFCSSDSEGTIKKKKQNLQKKRDALDPEKAILKYKSLAKYKALKNGEM